MKHTISTADRCTAYLLPIFLLVIDYIAIICAEQSAFVFRNCLLPNGGVLHISWLNFWLVFPLMYLLFINIEQLYSRRAQFWQVIQKNISCVHICCNCNYHCVIYWADHCFDFTTIYSVTIGIYIYLSNYLPLHY